MLTKIITFPGRADIILPEQLSRTMRCVSCERNLHPIRSQKVCLYRGESEDAQIFDIKKFGLRFNPAFTPHCIQLVGAEKLYDQSIWIWYHKICGIEGCGWKLYPSQRKFEIFQNELDYMSLRDFKNLIDIKHKERYIEVGNVIQFKRKSS